MGLVFIHIETGSFQILVIKLNYTSEINVTRLVKLQGFLKHLHPGTEGAAGGGMSDEPDATLDEDATVDALDPDDDDDDDGGATGCAGLPESNQC